MRAIQVETRPTPKNLWSPRLEPFWTLLRSFSRGDFLDLDEWSSVARAELDHWAMDPITLVRYQLTL